MRRFDKTNEENWVVLDELWDRMDWKDARKQVLIIPPIAVASEMTAIVGGVVGECICPADGTVRNIVIRADFSDKPPALFRISVEGLAETATQIFEMAANILDRPVGIQVKPGSIVKVEHISGPVTRAGFSCLIDLPRQAKHYQQEFPNMEA